MTRIGIILGSTRPGRVGESVAQWVNAVAQQRSDADYELVDLQEVGLPLLDEPYPPALARYQNSHTLAWAAKVGSFDGFVFVTAEYNHSIPAALKNALDFLHAEWNDKAVGFVSYGSAGGARVVEHLRAVTAELSMASVRPQVMLPFATDFDDAGFNPSDGQREALGAVLDAVVRWSEALAPLRAPVTTPQVA